MDDARERLFAAEIEIRNLKERMDQDDEHDKELIAAAILPLETRFRLVERIVLGACAMTLIMVFTLWLTGVFGEYRTTPRLPLPTTPYDPRSR